MFILTITFHFHFCGCTYDYIITVVVVVVVVVVFRRPPVRAVGPNYEVVEFQHWSGTTLELVYVAIVTS